MTVAAMSRVAFRSVLLEPAQTVMRVTRLLHRSFWAAMDHDVFTVAQATAYSAIVALFPALIVAAAVVGMLPDTLPVRFQLAAFFDRILPSNVTPVLDAYFATTHKSPQTARVLAGSVVVSVTGAASVMATLMEGFRRAHDMPLPPGSFWPRRVRALVLVPLSMIPMTIASLLVVFGHFISSWMLGFVPGALQGTAVVVSLVMRWTIAVGVSVSILGMIYHLGTDLDKHVSLHIPPWVREPWTLLRRDWTWRASLPGAAVATALWFVSTLLFGWYVTRFANYSRVYGSLGVAIALLVWLYIIALSVLMGAEYNAQVALERRGPEAGAAATEALWKLPGWARRRTGRMAD